MRLLVFLYLEMSVVVRKETIIFQEFYVMMEEISGKLKKNHADRINDTKSREWN